MRLGTHPAFAASEGAAGVVQHLLKQDIPRNHWNAKVHDPARSQGRQRASCSGACQSLHTHPATRWPMGPRGSLKECTRFTKALCRLERFLSASMGLEWCLRFPRVSFPHNKSAAHSSRRCRRSSNKSRSSCNKQRFIEWGVLPHGCAAAQGPPAAVTAMLDTSLSAGQLLTRTAGRVFSDLDVFPDKKLSVNELNAYAAVMGVPSTRVFVRQWDK